MYIYLGYGSYFRIDIKCPHCGEDMEWQNDDLIDKENHRFTETDVDILVSMKTNAIGKYLTFSMLEGIY